MIDARAEPMLRRAGRTRRHLELRRGARTPEHLRKPIGTLQLPSERTDDGRIRILIADDHEIVRQGLRHFLDLDPARGWPHCARATQPPAIAAS